MQLAVGALEACCNPASGEIIPSPFRLSGFLLCNVPIVATMLFTKSMYVQVGHALRCTLPSYQVVGQKLTVSCIV